MAWLDPIDYIETIPRATMFGALYWTDQHDRILCLRSARNPSIWQLAGGDFDHGDITPFDTARREGAEETGIAYTGPERVLLVQYLAESTAWPCPKVGFVFDTGQLTDDQIGAIRLDPARPGRAHRARCPLPRAVGEGARRGAARSPRPHRRSPPHGTHGHPGQQGSHGVSLVAGFFGLTERTVEPRPPLLPPCSGGRPASCAHWASVTWRRRGRRRRAARSVRPHWTSGASAASAGSSREWWR
ncbi:NUDIX domain-containing protein [Streptacidiphilus jiangxiensis]|uniref:NUDIX domain-containing protein n=1 Tax=Streptacidiphilus jiangxiensis TaxID=235985 RepID=A0A1H8AHA9_STRJI|nr:NUDIX domain-containing protein [Streptacidiphilus jiangxiensis]